MLRVTFFALLLLASCHRDTDPPPMHPKEGELPPLPPSSGTPVGYLIDNASQLQLRDDQLAQMKEIDRSLSAQDDEIDTQLRLIEKPEADPEPAKGQPPPRHNNAPGAQIKTTPDAAKLHNARRDNDFEALKKAFALLDPAQKTSARKLLEDRGVTPPGSEAKQSKRTSDDGVPLEP
ncbi:MAG TPA: hypothetical protein VHN14_26255 [Kofleriaceae bacterium]|jgi:hypothetical protein|nr:hypothetical protein [Kofleriaceae bacterium]